VQPEGRRAADHLPADAPDAEQAQRAAVEPFRLRIRLLVPGARAQLRHVVGDAAIEREDEREGELRHRDGVLPGQLAT
jgi:hypothetical protein